jgi:uncharacterized surface protein with fasciclin (FAS1) repeats
MKLHRTVGAIATTAIALGATLALAPGATAADGRTSLAAVLTADDSGFDGNHRDYDIVTAAVLAVLDAEPTSAVSVLTQGNVRVTAFIPNDRAFMKLASALTGERVTREGAAFAAVASLGIPAVEKVLLYHVVPGATIDSAAALAADGARLQTALGDKVIKVRVFTHPTRIALRDYNRTLPNPSVILSQVDINAGNRQIAHGIDEVLMPKRAR